MPVRRKIREEESNTLLGMDFMNYSLVPSELKEFLLWLQQRTEKIWSSYSTASLKDFQRARVGGNDWKRGTKWLGGFSDSEIDSFEQLWNLKFPPDYRLFLRLLGAPDRPMFATWYEGSNLVQGERPSFYNWQTDGEAIRQGIDWPLEGILFDVENNVLWLDSWGARPNAPEGRQQRLAELIAEAPPLIPVIGHRYLLGTPLQAGNPVFSVYQSDIIIYGSDFRKFLIAELSELLEIDHNEAYRIAVAEITRTSLEEIPFWGEIILG